MLWILFIFIGLIVIFLFSGFFWFCIILYVLIDFVGGVVF